MTTSTVTVQHDNAALFRELIDRAFNHGDVDAIDRLAAPDLREHQFERPGSPPPLSGTAGLKKIVGQLRGGAADFHMHVEDVVVAGDMVWARLRATGTDTGGQLGNQPTGLTFDIQVMDVSRFENGLLVEHWGVPDRLSVLQQLHLWPPAAHR